MELKDVFSVIELARKLKVGPLYMDDVENHAAKNLAAFALLTVLLGVSISVFVDGVDLSWFGVTATSLMFIVVVAVIGIIANLLLPAPVDEKGNIHEKDTNKFVTYSILSFLLTVATFVAISIIFLMIGSDVNSFVDWLTVRMHLNFHWASIAVSVICSVLGTMFLYSMLYAKGRLVSRGWSLASYIFATVLICNGVFYFSHFIFLA
jgi:hypothetical protein